MTDRIDKVSVVTDLFPGPEQAFEVPQGPVPAISAESVSKAYRLGSVRVQALDAVSLAVVPGEMVCIMGKSGSGKSTLLRQLGLIDLPSDGRIHLEGREVTRLPESRRAALRLERLGYVFQEYALIASLTAEENVYLPAKMLGRRRRECRVRAAQLLEQVGLGDRMGHRPKELSGGEQQRVAIARALVNAPAILFADEPTANLDSISGRTVMETLTQLNRDLGVTVVFVSHDPDDRHWATRQITLRDGRVEGDDEAPP
jgi:putative ABC transport system ATP-binding protein